MVIQKTLVYGERIGIAIGGEMINDVEDSQSGLLASVVV